MAGKGGGGAWKVAYADFVTAMMAFFMVMWIVAQSKPVREAIAGYFTDPSGKVSRNGNGKSNGLIQSDGAPPASPHVAASREKQGSAPKSPDDEGKGKGAGRKPTILGLHDGNNLAVEMLVPFAEESADLDEHGQQVLDRMAGGLLGKLSKIEIRGHASARPLASSSAYHDAWDLCYARSQAVMKYLLSKGIEPSRIRLSQSAANEPATSAQNDVLSIPNCRVEVFVLSEIASNIRDLTKKEGEAPKKSGGKRVIRPAPTTSETE